MALPVSRGPRGPRVQARRIKSMRKAYVSRRGEHTALLRVYRWCMSLLRIGTTRRCLSTAVALPCTSETACVPPRPVTALRNALDQSLPASSQQSASARWRPGVLRVVDGCGAKHCDEVDGRPGTQRRTIVASAD